MTKDFFHLIQISHNVNHDIILYVKCRDFIKNNVEYFLQLSSQLYKVNIFTDNYCSHISKHYEKV